MCVCVLFSGKVQQMDLFLKSSNHVLAILRQMKKGSISKFPARLLNSSKSLIPF